MAHAEAVTRRHRGSFNRVAEPSESRVHLREALLQLRVRESLPGQVTGHRNQIATARPWEPRARMVGVRNDLRVDNRSDEWWVHSSKRSNAVARHK